MRRIPPLPLSDDDARDFAEASGDDLLPLFEAARAVRDRAWGRTVTYSPKVFLPVTNLCRNYCTYCAFRRSPRQAGAYTMTPDDIDRALEGARAAGCVEALLCLGDTPESEFPSYRRELATWGHASTVDYLCAISERALATGLLPHTNAGLLDASAMRRLRTSNVSLGLMLESASDRLCDPGMPHHRAPDKLPARRIAMIAAAGALAIPFTSGILLGIGETRRERIDALLVLRDLHRTHGHVQEIIVQNFRAHDETAMKRAPAPDSTEVAHAIAMARLILDDDVSVQSPPNLNPGATEILLDAGINDFGGISPVTPDFINPGYAWPHVTHLGEECARRGFTLTARLPIYDAFAARDAFLDATLRPHVDAARKRISAATNAGADATLHPSGKRSGGERNEVQA